MKTGASTLIENRNKAKPSESSTTSTMCDNDSNRLCELAHEYRTERTKEQENGHDERTNEKKTPIHIHCRYFDWVFRCFNVKKKATRTKLFDRKCLNDI